VHDVQQHSEQTVDAQQSAGCTIWHYVVTAIDPCVSSNLCVQTTEVHARANNQIYATSTKHSRDRRCAGGRRSALLTL